MTGWLVLAGGLLLIAGVAAFGLALCWGSRRGDDLAALAETVGVVPDGSHDQYPGMPEPVRDVCIDYLEQLWKLPARERAS